MHESTVPARMIRNIYVICFLIECFKFVTYAPDSLDIFALFAEFGSYFLYMSINRSVLSVIIIIPYSVKYVFSGKSSSLISHKVLKKLKLFKGKTEITEIIGGCILVLLAIWVIVSHYTGI